MADKTETNIIEAIEVAVDEASGEAKVALQLHLASLLVNDGQSERAFDVCCELLREYPANPSALDIAAKASRNQDFTERAERYEDLSDALEEVEDIHHTQDMEATSEDAVVQKLAPQKLAAQNAGADVVPLHVVRPASDDRLTELEAPPLTMADVAGMAKAKRRLKLAFLGPLRNPELRKLYGKSLRGGLLLWGPPGCGKTFLARAVAGELGAKFISVGLNDVLDMYVGQSERNVHRLFEEARRAAPCVLFFDEVDGIGQKRSHQQGANRNVVAQLLSEMDGVDGKNDGVFVLAATNHPWDVDTALRRPGRLDRSILVLPPDVKAREAILLRWIADRPTENIDVSALVARTRGFSGADLVHLCETATEYALESSIDTGEARSINMEDFTTALSEVSGSTDAWVHMAKNYAEFSNSEGAYDELLDYLRNVRIKA